MGLKVVGMGLVALIFCACSSYPPQHTPAAREPSASAAAVKNPVAASAANGTTPAPNHTFIKAGYQATTFKGQLYYCRTEAVTGTQFKRKVCLTEAQMREEQVKTQDMKDSLSLPHASPPCIQMSLCAGG
jgi:hypothetical protein